MKRTCTLVLTLALALGLLAGCGTSAPATTAASGTESAAASAAPSAAESAATSETAPSDTESQVAASTAAPAPDSAAGEAVNINIAALKGPTGMGMVKLMADSDAGDTTNRYTFTLSADPTEVVSKVISGEYDMACLPTNSAAAIYQKTNGAIEMLAVNTLGVLYLLQNTTDQPAITTWEELKGKTIYATGQGANPEYVLNMLLIQNGLDPETDVTIQFCASADEVLAACASGACDLCMLPEPSVSALRAKDLGFAPIFDLTEAWDKAVQDGSHLTQGCVVVQKAFLEAHPAEVDRFLEEYQASIDYVNENVDAAAALMAQYEIVGSEAIAAAALPNCHTVFLAGQEMKEAVTGYFQVLYDADPASIGGAMPDDAFYYLAP